MPRLSGFNRRFGLRGLVSRLIVDLARFEPIKEQVVRQHAEARFQSGAALSKRPRRSATALTHEAWLRLTWQTRTQWARRDVVRVHEALLAFEQVDPRAARVVEQKFFGGLEIDEIAEWMALSAATVKRDRALARA
jgi:ECF sigma factor